MKYSERRENAGPDALNIGQNQFGLQVFTPSVLTAAGSKHFEALEADSRDHIAFCPPNGLLEGPRQRLGKFETNHL